MKPQSIHFKARAREALDNPVLQENLRRFSGGGLAMLRAKAVESYGPKAFEGLRDAAEAIRNRGLEHLDTWIELFEKQATSRGATLRSACSRVSMAW